MGSVWTVRSWRIRLCGLCNEALVLIWLTNFCGAYVNAQRAWHHDALLILSKIRFEWFPYPRCQVGEADLQSRHNTLDFLKEHRKKKGTKAIMQSFRVQPERAPEFQTFLADSLQDYKTSYAGSNAGPWDLIRQRNQVSVDMLLNINKLDCFSSKNARRPVNVSTMDKLYPKLVLQGFWQGFLFFQETMHGYGMRTACCGMLGTWPRHAALIHFGGD